MSKKLKKAWLLSALLALQSPAICDEPASTKNCDSVACDAIAADDVYGSSCDHLAGSRAVSNRNRSRYCDFRYRTPTMIGDYFGGSAMGFRGDSVIDRLLIVADDLDSPNVLPGGGSVLTITEPGPVGVFSSSLTSVQQLQSLLRSASPLPALTLQGTVNNSATLTTLNTVSQIQSQLGSTGLAYDIIAVQPPPGSYNAGVQSVFQARNAIPGSTVYNSGASGALIQGGVDTLNGGEDFDAFYFYDYIVRFNTALADATSGGVGRMKIAENGAVLPTDRVFFRYSSVRGVAFSNGRHSLNRFVPGIEKTLFDGLTSLEVRAPFATDATTTSSFDGSSFTNGYDTRFGNLTLYAKAILHQTERLAFTGGLGIALPTASDIRVNYANGNTLLRVQNDSMHLQPFLGMLYTPNTRFYAQGFVQYDATASGNRVAINAAGAGLQQAGRLTDPNHIYLDAGLGYWLYRGNGNSGLTGIVPTVEVHQTSSTQDGDVVAAGPFQVGNFSGSTSITSIAAGTTLEFGRQSQLTAGYATPIGGGVDRQYNGAFQVNFNGLFGP